MDDWTEIPAAFWAALTFEEFNGICARDGLLTRAQTLRAWQMSGGSGPPPAGRMRLLLAEADVERWIQSLKDKGFGQRRH
jgi:hypothetical protein